jgi:hypothetical protein
MTPEQEQAMREEMEDQKMMVKAAVKEAAKAMAVAVAKAAVGDFCHPPRRARVRVHGCIAYPPRRARVRVHGCIACPSRPRASPLPHGVHCWNPENPMGLPNTPCR